MASNREAAEELVGFLTSTRVDLRKAAVDGVLGFTTTEENRRLLRDVQAPRKLGRLLGDREAVAVPALKALINLSEDSGCIGQMIKARLVTSCMESLRDRDCQHKRLLVMLMANLCQTPAGVDQVLQRDEADGRLMGLHLLRLVQFFLQPVQPGQEDDFDHIGLVLQNVTGLEEARQVLLEPARGILRPLLAQLDAKSVNRRRGVAGTLRNCCFDHASQRRLLGLDEESVPGRQGGLIVDLLAPIVGPEVLDLAADRLAAEVAGGDEAGAPRSGDGQPSSAVPKAWIDRATAGGAREPDAQVRRLLLEAVLVLARSSREARDLLRLIGAYKVIRSTHMWIVGLDEEEEGDESAAGAQMRAAVRASAEDDAAQREAAATGPDGAQLLPATDRERQALDERRAAAGLPPLAEEAAKDAAEEAETALAAASGAEAAAGAGGGVMAAKGGGSWSTGPQGDYIEAEVPNLSPDDEGSVKAIIELVNLIHGDETPGAGSAGGMRPAGSGSLAKPTAAGAKAKKKASKKKLATRAPAPAATPAFDGGFSADAEEMLTMAGMGLEEMD